mmetsp:Transcript_29707/g.66638  ORF Transcript_29707/g.66638 Transcript_29707/m.66638 type:complete len:234 (-) Transcript_29707:88-789(-)
MENGFVVEVHLRDDELDHLLHEALADGVHRDLLRVLRRDDHRVHPLRNRHAALHLVLHRHLRLAVGTYPVQNLRLANLCESQADARGKVLGEGHQSLRLVRRVAEHDPLVPGARVLDLRRVDGLRDVGALLLDGHDDIHRLVVEALGRVVVPDLLQSLTDHQLIVHRSRGRDLAKYHNHTSLRAAFASHAGGRVIFDARIQDRVRHLIADFVWVAFINTLAREKKRVTIGSCS